MIEEPSTEHALDDIPALVEELRRARNARLGWEKVEQAIEAQIQKRLADNGAEVATLAGKAVFTWKPTSRFASTRFEKEYPELAERYKKPEVTYRIDTQKLRETNPDLYNQFRVRQFKVLED